MLDVQDIVTAYGKIEALKGVSLTVAEGRITCLLGPNGAGKTTLMYSIAGVLKPRRGTIRLGGADITGHSPAAIVARGLALVPENRLVFPQMSVAENLEAGAATPRKSPPISSACTRGFPVSRSGAPSSPARCRAANSRCSRSRAP
jgi:branched-chain amino acid transport system ATP-binding protein